MPLTPEEQQELEMLELEELEAKYGQEDPQFRMPASSRDQLDPMGLATGETPRQRAREVVGPVEAAAAGIGQTATLGHLPQVRAAAQPQMEQWLQVMQSLGIGEPGKSPAQVDAELRAQGFTGDIEPETYGEARERAVARQETGELGHPGLTMAGKAAGMLTPAGGARAVRGAGEALRAGERIRRGAQTGAAMGAGYNPGDVGQEIDPLQLKERLEGAGLGMLLGAPMGAVGAGTGRLAARERMVERVKEPGRLAADVKRQITEQGEEVGERYIRPRAEQRAALLEGREVDINPERLRGISPGLDKLAELLGKRVPEGAQRATMKAPRAQRLKQALEQRAKYTRGTPFEPTAEAKQKTAGTAAGLLREKLGEVPGVSQLNKEMAEAIRLREALRRRSATAPIGSITGKPTSDRAAVVSSLDEMAGKRGRGLGEFGQEIRTAQQHLLDPKRLVAPLEMPKEVRRMIVRGAQKAGQAAERVGGLPGVRETPDMVTLSLLEQLRKARGE